MVHHQVLESDRKGYTPSSDALFDLEYGTCIELIIDMIVTHKIQVYSLFFSSNNSVILLSNRILQNTAAFKPSLI